MYRAFYILLITSVFFCSSTQPTQEDIKKKRENERELQRRIKKEKLPEFHRYSLLREWHPWMNIYQYNTIRKYSNKYKLNPSLVMALILYTSGGNAGAQGPLTTVKVKKDGKWITWEERPQGLMYVMSYMSEGPVEELYRVEPNIKAGTKHLAWCLRKANNRLKDALKNYDSGAGSTNYNKEFITNVVKMYQNTKHVWQL